MGNAAEVYERVVRHLPSEERRRLAQMIQEIEAQEERERPTAPAPSVAERKASLDRLAEIGRGTPPLSDYAVSREGLYEDHL